MQPCEMRATALFVHLVLLPSVAECFLPTPTSPLRASAPRVRASSPRAALSFESAESMHLLQADGTAALIASAVATCLLHPLDTLKTRQQHATATPLPAALATPPADTAATAAATEQPHMDNLQRGIFFNVLKEAPDAAVYLAFYELLSRSLLSDPYSWFASHTMITFCLAGAAGDAAGSVLRLPAEIVCKRMQTDASTSVGEALIGTSLDGWLVSWAAILSRDVPMGGLQVAFYHQCHLWLGEALVLFEQSMPGSMSDVLAGCLAGAVAAALTTPLDVIVTHCMTGDNIINMSGGAAHAQAETGHEASSGESNVLWRAALSVRRLVDEEGPRTLTKGLGLRTLYYAPNIGIFFGLYECLRRILE